MTIIRESRGPMLERLIERARQEVGEEFAEGLAAMIEKYRAVISTDWPQWPTPGDTRAEAKRIIDAAAELLTAHAEASEAFRVRLRYHLGELGLRQHALDTGGELFVKLGSVMEAAATIYRAQPVNKEGRPARRRNETRAGFLRALRQHFEAHRAPWASTADEYVRTSLAVEAVAIALDAKPTAASKAIQRMDTPDA